MVDAIVWRSRRLRAPVMSETTFVLFEVLCTCPKGHKELRHSGGLSRTGQYRPFVRSTEQKIFNAGRCKNTVCNPQQAGIISSLIVDRPVDDQTGTRALCGVGDAKGSVPLTVWDPCWTITQFEFGQSRMWFFRRLFAYIPSRS
jgi:hypothetical protein